jgi:hypothetical protein
VAVLLGDGTGGFSLATSVGGVGPQPSVLAIGDLNDDKNLDLAVPNIGSNTVSVLPGDGAGGFGPAVAFTVGGALPGTAVIGDLNGDGLPDVVTSNRLPSTVSVLLNNTDTTAPEITTPSAIVVDATGSGGAVVAFTVTATDPDDAASEPVCTPPSGSTFPIGTTTVTCTSTDTHGNTGTAGFTVTVRPFMPCSLGCRQHITVNVSFVPAPDNPQLGVEIRIGATFIQAGVTDGETVGPIGFEPGTYAIQETGSVLAAYTSSIRCTGESSASPVPHLVSLRPAVDVACEITNTRKQAERSKHKSPPRSRR